MPNMSYCRFHNTLIALRDCLGALEELESCIADKDDLLSRSEARAAEQLVTMCGDIFEQFAEMDFDDCTIEKEK